MGEENFMSGIQDFRNKLRKWRVPSFLLNKYVFTTFIFLIWMIFFDQNNAFVQMERYRELQDARQKMEYYQEETVKTAELLDELMTNDVTLEKFAREKYYMKKPNEDVFVIVKK
jgi:cell division protein DivIC